MQTELLSLSKIFTERLFRIPDYQRGYSWNERQIKDFWSDIVQLGKGSSHYTGVLTLQDVSKVHYERWQDDLWIIDGRSYKPFYVVDGQQRLTTALILIQAIIETVPSELKLNYNTLEEIQKKYIFESRDGKTNRSYIFGYEKDNPSYDYLVSRIFNQPLDSHSTGEETIYTHNLEAAKSFFLEQLKGMNLDKLAEVYRKLTQHFLFNIYVISDSDGINVFVAFETMNNRGKLLSHLELLKNRLIFLSTRLNSDDSEKDNLRKIINESWKTAYHYLGRSQARPIDDDHFLWVQFMLYMALNEPKKSETSAESDKRWAVLNSYRDDEDYKTYLLETYFTPANIDDAKLQEASQKISISAKLIFDYAHNLKRCVETYYRIINPSDSKFNDRIQIQLERLYRIGNERALPLIIALWHRKPNAAAFEEFLIQLERHLFIRSLCRSYYRDDLKLIDMAIEVENKTKNIKSITDEIKSSCDSSTKISDIGDALSAMGKNTRGYYGWDTTRYFLFEYEQELKKKSRSNRDKISWPEFNKEDFARDYATVEHIYPHRANGPYWKNRFNAFSIRQRNVLRQSIGNLLALSRGKNSSLSNQPFDLKKEGTEDKSGYRHGSYSEIEISKYAEWTPINILERGLRLLEFMEKRWALSLGNSKAKTELLRLGFLKSKNKTR